MHTLGTNTRIVHLTSADFGQSFFPIAISTRSMQRTTSFEMSSDVNPIIIPHYSNSDESFLSDHRGVSLLIYWVAIRYLGLIVSRIMSPPSAASVRTNRWTHLNQLHCRTNCKEHSPSELLSSRSAPDSVHSIDLTPPVVPELPSAVRTP